MTTVNGVIFNKVDGLIRAEQESAESTFFLSEVLKAAKSAGLPLTGWRKSEFTETFIMEVK